MARTFPEGWFERGMLWWGGSLDDRASFSRGARIEVPDLRSADHRTILDLREQQGRLLACIAEGVALQVQWTVQDDFGPDLEGYADAGAGAGPWCARTRSVRARYYASRRREGSLRRERVHIYLGRRCEGLPRSGVRSLPACEAYLSQMSVEFEARLRALEQACGLVRWTALGDRGHAEHLTRFLNPGLMGAVLSQGPLPFDPGLSVRAQCLKSDIDVFALRGHGGPECHLHFDGVFNALFVLRELPRGTRPGMLLPVLDCVSSGVSISLNIYPLSVDREIERLRAEMEELGAFVGDRKAVGVENDILRRRSRIDSLLSTLTIPFKMLFVVRVWDPTLEGLYARSLAVRTALSRMDGGEFMQVNARAQAVQLFHETIPGYLGGDYRGWDVYVENKNLVDLLPISTSFTGHLSEAQALYDSPAGALVGLRLLTAGGTPQHTLVLGVNGSGKSAFLMDLLSQTDWVWAYRFIQEEGLAFVTQAALCGMRSLAVRESGECTVNPFDTGGLPLSATAVSCVVRTCMKLVGLSRDEDRNRRREALIGEYVSTHFEDTAADWKAADEQRWYALARRALAADRLRAQDDGLVDGFLALRDLEQNQPDQARILLEGAAEEEVAAFANQPAGRRTVTAMVFTLIGGENYPRFSGLVSLMRHGRLGHHRSAGVAEEMDFLSSELAKGCRVGGVVGPFLDGATNVPLCGGGLHFDTSRLPDGTLKEVAGFVVFDRVRQHILSLPRASAKIMVLDELRRILRIPGAGEFVKELLAQMRKYRCVFVGALQEISQVDDIDPALTDLLLGQCKQHILMRQNNADQVSRVARIIGLPGAAQRAVLQHPLVEHQSGAARASAFTLFSREGGAPVCGTVRVELDPYLLYVAESSGATFDSRARALRAYPDAFEGVVAEVNARLAGGPGRPARAP